MMNKKMLGWALVVIGLVSVWGSWQYGYGIATQITMAIVALVGFWLALWKGKGGQQPPMGM
ncbi:MAG: hypothetical protein Q7R91_03085 [bacterium]|nr:hypothetical protein [bacterium]